MSHNVLYRESLGEQSLFKLIFLLGTRSISTSDLLIFEIMVYFGANDIFYLLNLKST